MKKKKVLITRKTLIHFCGASCYMQRKKQKPGPFSLNTVRDVPLAAFVHPCVQVPPSAVPRISSKENKVTKSAILGY